MTATGQADDLLIAQISDTHAIDPALGSDSIVDNNERMRTAVASLAAEVLPPVRIVHTGDATNDGHPGEYDVLVETFEPLADRLRILPGNHDDPDEIRRRFPDQPWADTDHGSWVETVGGVTLIGLDSTKRGEHGGHLDDARLTWVADQLAAAPGPSVLCLHHPPFRSGLAWMDDGQLRPHGALDEIVAGAPGLERIWCGHLHRPITTTVGGVTTITCPTTSQRIGLDLRPEAPISVIAEPAAYQLHLRTEGGWVTHTRPVDLGIEPIVPDWA